MRWLKLSPHVEIAIALIACAMMTITKPAYMTEMLFSCGKKRIRIENSSAESCRKKKRLGLVQDAQI
jgi:hypothetical protein